MSVSVEYAERFDPNYSGFVAFGAGLPRTGTMSLRAALGKIYQGKCYHMIDVLQGSNQDLAFWNDICDGKKKSKEDWDKFLQGRGYRSGVDFPISLFYKELLSVYPDAKVILTVRNPETWHESAKNSIYKLHKLLGDFACRSYLRMLGHLANGMTVDRVSSVVPKGFKKGIFPVIEAGQEESVAFFNKWVKEVKATVPKDRLLVFEVKEGWEPLCKFLDVPIPDGPFPRVNDTKTLAAKLNSIKMTSWFLFYGMPVLSVVAAVAYQFRDSVVQCLNRYLDFSQ